MIKKKKVVALNPECIVRLYVCARVCVCRLTKVKTVVQSTQKT